MHGIVHDENARWFGGVAGHAGLFAPAADLARLAACFLRHGEGFVEPPTLQHFVRPANIVPNSSRCLGWHGIDEKCSGGRHLAPGSYGHTGFTGTSLWIDPQNDRFVVLLANAVHPKRECKSQGFFAWRRVIHEAVYLALNLDATA
jgi:CubicO group peptidase (beta-lactamase class C family)